VPAVRTARRWGSVALALALSLASVAALLAATAQRPGGGPRVLGQPVLAQQRDGLTYKAYVVIENSGGNPVVVLEDGVIARGLPAGYRGPCWGPASLGLSWPCATSSGLWSSTSSTGSS